MQRHNMIDIWKRNGRTARREHVIRISGQRFGRDRAAVERKIKRFLSAA